MRAKDRPLANDFVSDEAFDAAVALAAGANAVYAERVGGPGEAVHALRDGSDEGTAVYGERTGDGGGNRGGDG